MFLNTNKKVGCKLFNFFTDYFEKAYSLPKFDMIAITDRTSKKEKKVHEILEHPFDSSPNVRHALCMSDEGDFSRITSPLKICEIFTPIF